MFRDANETPPEIRYEFPDPTPVEAPVPSRPVPNTLAKLIAEQRARAALEAQNIAETFEESDDFDIEDDPIDPATPWEVAADAATMTADELFMRVYGISREDALKKLQDLTPKPDPSPSPTPPLETGS